MPIQLQTEENVTITIRAPKNAVLGAGNVDDRRRMAMVGQYFDGLASGAAAGRSRVCIHKGSTSAIPSYATGTVIAATVAAADTVTINGAAITAIKQRASSTATFVSCVADNTITVNGIVFTAKTAPAAAHEFQDKSGVFTDTDTAASLAAKVNAATDAAIITIASLQAADVIKVNGTSFTARSSLATVAASTDFFIGASDTASAVNFSKTVRAKLGTTFATLTNAAGVVTVAPVLGSVFSLNGNARAIVTGLVGIIGATSAATVTTLRATRPGDEGQNQYTLAKVGVPITITGIGYIAGGVAVANNEFESNGASDAEVASDIARCIAASTTALVGKAVVGTNIAGKVTCAAVAAGDTVTVGQTVFTGITLTGGETLAPNAFDRSGADTQGAASLVAQVNSHPDLKDRVLAMNTAAVVLIHLRPPVVTPYPALTSSSGSTLAVVAFAAVSTSRLFSTIEGVGGNQATLASSNGSTLAVSGPRLTGGVGGDGVPSTIFSR